MRVAAPLSALAAGRKGIASPLAEDTDLFIAPNIEPANSLYRAILYFGRGESCGIVVGPRPRSTRDLRRRCAASGLR